MERRNNNRLKGLLFLMPLLLGFIGLRIKGSAPLDALYTAVTMYGLNYNETPANAAIQVARWTAPLATAGGIAMLFAPVVRALRAKWLYLSGDSVAVYGDRDCYEALKKDLAHARVTFGTDKLLPAHRYVLFMDEAENLRFYLENREELEKREVWMRCSSLRSQEIRGGHLHLYSVEEVGARLFWKQADLYRLFAEKGPELHIALVGFGALGEQILLWGLQNNIFSPDQTIRYDVFGPDNGFLALHPELGRLSDPVRFHGGWKEDPSLLRDADLIVVCEQADQLLLIEELLFTLNPPSVAVLAAHPKELTLLESAGRLCVFPWKEEALRGENLFDGRTLTRAKAINLRYAHLYAGTEETPENAEAEWLKLNSFTRYSNISAADYHEIRLQMMKSWGCASEADLSAERLELLSVLEHIRWCRFHWLNNWTYGDPVGGKAKNTAARTHSNLVPYDELSEEDKEKDRENIRTLLRIG